MNAKEFVRECYLSSVPSIDIEATTEIIDCTKHTLLTSVWEQILAKYAKTENEKVSASMWCVCSGPHLVEG